MKKITILGSTGSVGVQGLNVARAGGHEIVALTAGQNVKLLAEQISQFCPKYGVVATKEGAEQLKTLVNGTTQVLYGQEGIEQVAALSENDIVLNATLGIAGLRGTVAAIKAKTTLALANKESLVCAGQIVMKLAKENNVAILPVDSEHSAIFQGLLSGESSQVESLILTASGGPFFGKTTNDLQDVTGADALKHPSWSMGNKITIDSATLMNKGFELIEAMWLFGIEPSRIQVVVHRESIIHSAVEFVDGNVIAQLSNPDMRLPIQYALTYPRREALAHKRLNLAEIGSMSFYTPDTKTFKALPLCIQAAEQGGNRGCIINGANEVAVAEFLAGNIKFLDIYNTVEYAYNKVAFIKNPSLNDIFETDKQARAVALDYIYRG